MEDRMAEAVEVTGHKLNPWEGKEVVGSRVEIPGAAGGLQESLKFDPREIRSGDELYVVLKVTCQKVRFEPIEKDMPDGAQYRVHVLKPVDGGSMFVPDALVAEYIEAQREKITLDREAAAGIQRLVEVPGDEEDFGFPSGPTAVPDPEDDGDGDEDGEEE